MNTDIYNGGASVQYNYPADTTFLFADVETANQANDTICAIGVILVKNGVQTGYYSLIDPLAPITLTYIHGITSQDVQGAPTLDKFWQVIQPLVGTDDYVSVAHNCYFDLTVMHKDLARYGIPFAPKRLLDTMWVARDIMYNRRTVRGDLKLDVLSRRLGVGLDHHNAASDIAATKQVLDKLLVLGNRNIKEFIRPSTRA